MPLDLSRFIVRPAVLCDAEDIVRIQRAAVEKAWRHVIGAGFDAFLAEKFNHESQLAKYRERIVDPARVLLVVRDGEKPVGFGGARPHAADEQPKGYEYQGNAFYLLPKAEGTGASLALATGIRDTLIKRGIKSVCGWCLADNRKARNFYERRGAQLVKDAVAPPEYDIAPHVAYGWKLP
jgi:hypothetical protein